MLALVSVPVLALVSVPVLALASARVRGFRPAHTVGTTDFVGYKCFLVHNMCSLSTRSHHIAPTESNMGQVLALALGPAVALGLAVASLVLVPGWIPVVKGFLKEVQLCQHNSRILHQMAFPLFRNRLFHNWPNSPWTRRTMPRHSNQAPSFS